MDTFIWWPVVLIVLLCALLAGLLAWASGQRKKAKEPPKAVTKANTRSVVRIVFDPNGRVDKSAFDTEQGATEATYFNFVVERRVEGKWCRDLYYEFQHPDSWEKVKDFSSESKAQSFAYRLARYPLQYTSSGRLL